MNILIAPDKFKGSLTALQVCEAVKEGILSKDPDFKIHSLPMADGGEGTGALLTAFSGGSTIKCKVLDPLFREIESEFGITNDRKTAFIEMAKASGLQLLDSADRNPMKTSTIGTGQLIAAALNMNVDRIVLGVGGSATTDAGMGMAGALGYEFLSAENKKLPLTGENLGRVKNIVETNLHPQLRKTAFTIIYDVHNPFFGEQGAAKVFARQKGATDEQIALLDNGLQMFAQTVKSIYDLDLNFPGAGAGGGLGGGAKLFLKANYSPGIDFIIDFTKLEEAIKSADLVITGEGRIDVQTFSGKVVQGVARLAHLHHKKCIAVCGKCELTPGQLAELGVTEALALSDRGTGEHRAMTDAFELLKEKTADSLFPLDGPLNLFGRGSPSL